MKQLNERKLLKINKKQADRLAELREQRVEDNVKTQPRKEYKSGLEKDDPIFVCVEGVSFSGYFIEEVKRAKILDDIQYRVSTPHGELVVPRFSIRGRRVMDYSNVVVPEELKAMNTHRLLRELDLTRKQYSSDYYDYYQMQKPKFTAEQIKAVLSTREHVPSKKEAKIAKKYLSNG